MRAQEPSWWYGARPGQWLPNMLVPLGWCYGALTSQRMQRAPRYRTDIPVVCIGNFTAGGTGKTPFVATLCDLLCLRGHQPVVLTRGYGGSLTGPHWVDPTMDTAARVGDEALLLSQRWRVMLARNRAAGAHAIHAGQADHPRATVIVMDDGIQNPALAKDLTIAVIDARRGVGNGRCIPAGPLRAPLRVQLPRADALLLNTGNCAVGTAYASQLPVHFGGPVLSASVAPSGDLGWLSGRAVVAYAGIGVPARFFATAAACGALLRQKIEFADHHPFSEQDALRLLALAKAEAASLVTTEKDLARLAGKSGVLGALREASRALPIKLQLDAASLALLSDLIANRVPLPA